MLIVSVCWNMLEKLIVILLQGVSFDKTPKMFEKQYNSCICLSRIHYITLLTAKLTYWGTFNTKALI